MLGPERAKTVLLSVIEVDERNVKAHFRLAKTFTALKHTDLLEKHLKRARELAPDDKAIQKHFAVLKRLQAAENKKSAGFYKNMFSAVGADAGDDKQSETEEAKQSDAAAAAAAPPADDVELDEEVVRIEDDDDDDE